MTEEKKILVTILQTALAGKIDPSTNFSPQLLADAIIDQLNLNRTLTERNARNVEETINKFKSFINEINEDMDIEAEQLGNNEVLLKNFINGQKTACEKLNEKLETI